MLALSEQDFWFKVDMLSGPVPAHCPELGNCWIWTGSGRSGEYGNVGIEGRTYLAHRLSWQLVYGSIPMGKPYILHRCDNPLCVRPDHLFAGTSRENTQDMLCKNRWQGGRPRAGNHEGETHECIECGRRRKNQGRGLCGACHEANRKAGTLDRYPSRYEWRNVS